MGLRGVKRVVIRVLCGGFIQKVLYGSVCVVNESALYLGLEERVC